MYVVHKLNIYFYNRRIHLVIEIINSSSLNVVSLESEVIPNELIT